MKQHALHCSSVFFWIAGKWLITLAVSALLCNGCAGQQPSSPVRQNGPLYIPASRPVMVTKHLPPRIEKKPASHAENKAPVPIPSPQNRNKKACPVFPASPATTPAGNHADASPASPGTTRQVSPVVPPQSHPRPPHLETKAQPRIPSNTGDNQKNKALVTRLIPVWVSNREDWSKDIFISFNELDLPVTKENVCAAVAVIEQESSFKADPEVPGLPKICWRELEKLRNKYFNFISKETMNRLLAMISPDGRSYRSRINILRTERQLDLLFRDFFSTIPFGPEPYMKLSMVKTAGPMQVSIEYAEQHVKKQPYPFSLKGSLRDEVFSRRGGVYFGIANLLDYPAQYPSPCYRFADFNAGHYSCRNAAFQKAVALLSKRPLVLDGDLLQYWHGTPSSTASATRMAMFCLRDSLWLSAEDINRDLRMEKEAGFVKTITYQRVMDAADRATRKKFPRQIIPEIRLKSPKIQRKLTTEWFAKRVEERYESCLERE